MNNFKKHIAFKILTVLLTVTLLVPMATKFAHIFTHHKHDICLGEKATHLHETNTDCDFYKFKIKTPFYLPTKYFELTCEVLNFKIDSNLYTFLVNHRQLSFSLRGPPALV